MILNQIANDYFERMITLGMKEPKSKALIEKIKQASSPNEPIIYVTPNGSTKFTVVMLETNKEKLIGIAKRCTYKKKEDRFKYAVGICIAASRLFPPE